MISFLSNIYWYFSSSSSSFRVFVVVARSLMHQSDCSCKQNIFCLQLQSLQCINERATTTKTRNDDDDDEKYQYILERNEIIISFSNHDDDDYNNEKVGKFCICMQNLTPHKILFPRCRKPLPTIKCSKTLELGINRILIARGIQWYKKVTSSMNCKFLVRFETDPLSKFLFDSHRAWNTCFWSATLHLAKSSCKQFAL